MDWSNILSIGPDELTAEVLEAIPNHLSSVDTNALSDKELRTFFELSRFLIQRLSTGTHETKTQPNGESHYKKSTENLKIINSGLF